MLKLEKSKFDDLHYWNTGKSLRSNPIEYFDDDDDDDDEDERSLALSVNLLLKHKNISQANHLRLPSHLITSENCSCTRSFHLFCTELFPQDDSTIDMIYIHPAPRHHDRDSTRQLSSSIRKSRSKYQEEDNEQDNIATVRSEPSHIPLPETQLLEKKLRVPPKLPSRTTSLNIPSTYHSFQRSLQASIKYSSSIRTTKPSPANVQLHIRALSVFDQSPFASQLFLPRGPPPSPKTPTQESSMIFTHSITAPPLRTVAITPRLRYSHENERKFLRTPSRKKSAYEDHAREYLSASDCSDNEKDNEKDDNDDDDENKKDLSQLLTITKPKLPTRNPTVSRPETALRDRLISQNTNRYLSLAEVYYSSLDVYKNLSDKSRRRLRAQTPLMASNNENDDAATTMTKTTGTTKTVPVPQSKSVFGFSKTASSMHFGHAAGRLGLHASFEKWPQPLSRRTPIERKQEVTALRLVTLPLITS